MFYRLEYTTLCTTLPCLVSQVGGGIICIRYSSTNTFCFQKWVFSITTACIKYVQSSHTLGKDTVFYVQGGAFCRPEIWGQLQSPVGVPDCGQTPCVPENQKSEDVNCYKEDSIVTDLTRRSASNIWLLFFYCQEVGTNAPYEYVQGQCINQTCTCRLTDTTRVGCHMWSRNC